MIERLLKSWTRVPLIVDTVMELAPSTRGADPATHPWPMLAQQAGGDVEADFQPEALEDLVLHAVGSPARLVGRGFGDPLGDLDGLRLIERAPLPIEGSFEAAMSAAPESDVDGSRDYAGSFGRQFDRHAVTHVCERE